MREIKVIVDILKNGEVNIDVNGVSDNKCIDITKSLEENLGNVVKRDMKEKKSFINQKLNGSVKLGGR